VPLQSIQTDNIHLESYTMDRKEEAQCEKEVFEVYEKDLNLTFVVVRSCHLLPQPI